MKNGLIEGVRCNDEAVCARPRTKYLMAAHELSGERVLNVVLATTEGEVLDSSTGLAGFGRGIRQRENHFVVIRDQLDDGWEHLAAPVVKHRACSYSKRSKCTLIEDGVDKKYVERPVELENAPSTPAWLASEAKGGVLHGADATCGTVFAQIKGRC